MAEAIDVCTEILENLKKFGQIDEVEFKAPVFILLGLIMKAQRMEQQLSSSGDSQVGITAEDKKVATRALDIYEASLSSSKNKIRDIFGLASEDDVVCSWLIKKEDEQRSSSSKNESALDHIYSPQWALVTDHEEKHLVLAIRGTFSISDVVIDVVCDDEPFVDGFAHKGILRGAKKVFEETRFATDEGMNETVQFRHLISSFQSFHRGGFGSSPRLRFLRLRPLSGRWNCRTLDHADDG